MLKDPGHSLFPPSQEILFPSLGHPHSLDFRAFMVLLALVLCVPLLVILAHSIPHLFLALHDIPLLVVFVPSTSQRGHWFPHRQLSRRDVGSNMESGGGGGLTTTNATMTTLPGHQRGCSSRLCRLLLPCFQLSFVIRQPRPVTAVAPRRAGQRRQRPRRQGEGGG